MSAPIPISISPEPAEQCTWSDREAPESFPGDIRSKEIGECTVAFCKGPGSNEVYCMDEWRLMAGDCPFSTE